MEDGAGNPPFLILTDLPCLACGYNLRTLPIDAVCPECATPVPESLRGDGLAGGTPPRLKRLRLGATMGITYIAICVLFELTNLVAPWRYMTAGWRAYRATRITAVWLIAPVVQCLAILLLTSRVTDAVRADPAHAVRFALRIVAAVSTVMAGAAGLSYLYFTGGGAYAPALLRALLVAPQHALTFVLLRSLARRLPDARLARRATVLAWACSTCATILFAASFGLDFLARPSGRLYETVMLPARWLAIACAIAAAAFLWSFGHRIAAILLAKARAAVLKNEPR